jgi:N-carbamoyl-L-amino-acid hydrolase
MNPSGEKLLEMGKEVEDQVKTIGSMHGLGTQTTRTLHLLPGDFTPEAVDCVKRACGEKGIGSRTLTGHDSLMTIKKAPTGMVFVRSRGGISHSAKEWSDQEDCAEGALVLGKAVLNFDEHLKQKTL